MNEGNSDKTVSADAKMRTGIGHTIGAATPRLKRMRFLMASLPEGGRLTIVDVGANPVHVPPYRHLLESGGCSVIGFEPQAEALAALQSAKGEFETYLPHAVGRPGCATLNLYPSPGFTSLYRLDVSALKALGRFQRLAGKETTQEVELSGLDDLDAVPDIDLLKMDVQGAECDVLASARRKLAAAVVVIPEMRFHRLYEGEPLFADLDLVLREQGFTLHKFLPLKHVMLSNSQGRRLRGSTIKNQLVDGDAVYIRDLAGIESWSDLQVARLALAADAVFDSPDLALRCLDQLVARSLVSSDVPVAYADLLPGVPQRSRRRKQSEDAT